MKTILTEAITVYQMLDILNLIDIFSKASDEKVEINTQLPAQIKFPLSSIEFFQNLFTPKTLTLM